MSRPLVIGYHIILNAYGSWLPVDPRGSFSHKVRAVHLESLGDFHHGRRKNQPTRQELRQYLHQIDGRLEHPRREFSARDRTCIAAAVSDCLAENVYTCYGCAILQDHVHLLLRKHKHKAEEMAYWLRSVTRGRLLEVRRWPKDHPVWSEGVHLGFLDSPEAIRSVIRYIEGNGVKHFGGIQKWEFVKTYDGWPLHPGHNPNSPYARRLRKYGRDC
ncbi:MAG: hypothetical protein ACLFUJ_16735 [Phycisphaerae bacterium]